MGFRPGSKLSDKDKKYFGYVVSLATSDQTLMRIKFVSL